MMRELLFVCLAASVYKSIEGSNAIQNYSDECKNGLNQRIANELEASYTYMAMAAHFSHDDNALPGFAKFFSKASDEEREHASKMIEYQNKRGGVVELQKIKAPARGNWANGLAAMESALTLEKKVNAELLSLHATCASDPSLQHFLESHFLNEQVESIKQLADYIAKLKRLHRNSAELGEYIFDKEL